MQRISTLILNFRHSMYNFENTVGRVTRTGLIRRVSVALSVVTTNDNYKVADTSKRVSSFESLFKPTSCSAKL